MGGAAGAIIAAAAARREREMITALRESSALSANAAIAITPRGQMGRAVLRRLMEGGAVKEAAGPRYWLDERAYEDYRIARNQRATWIIGAIMLVLIGGLAAIFLLKN
jgi:hypothetical protein